MPRKPKFYQTRAFKNLESEWEERLQADGLAKKETHKGTVMQDLSERVNFTYRRKEANEAYYSWAASILQIAKFKSERHKIIWERHVQGLSAAAIGRELKLSRWRISDILTEIKEGLKSIEKGRSS